jgi:hypothetical protein
MNQQKIRVTIYHNPSCGTSRHLLALIWCTIVLPLRSLTMAV